MSAAKRQRSSIVKQAAVDRALKDAADLECLLSESREQIARGEVLRADQVFAHLKP